MKTYLYTCLVMLMLLLSMSCKKSFLEIVPKGQVLASTVKDYDGLMNHTSFYANYYGLPGLVMGDELAAEAVQFPSAPLLTQRGFAWMDQLYDATVSSAQLDVELKNIYICNKVINEVLHIADGTEAQRKNIRAEALANRAWSYFGLITCYGKPYLASSAATDPGLPIILTAEISNTGFKRNSVSEVYQQILSDLKVAIPDLSTQVEVKTRVSRQAAMGMLGKVYLFMGQYEEAKIQFDAAFADLATTSSTTSLYDYNEAFLPTGVFQPFGRFGPNNPGNNTQLLNEAILHKTAILSGDFSNTGLVMTKETMDLYKPSDLRLNFYSNMRSNFTPLPPGLYGKYALTYAHTGLELADMILMRAEVRARTGNTAGAVQDLEWLRKNRMPSADASVPSTVTADPLKLLNFILEERIREFAGEGYRWPDMRRLSVDPLFSSKTYRHLVFGEDGTSIKNTYTLKPERFTLRLPQLILAGNPDMINNP